MLAEITSAWQMGQLWNSFKKHSNSTRRWTKGSLPPKSPLHVLCLHSSHQQFMLADLWSCLRFMAGKQSMEAPEESISSCPWAKSCPYQQALSQVLGCRELIWGQLLFVTPSNKSLVCSCPSSAELPELLGVHPRERIHSCQGLECFPCSLTCPWSLKPYKSLWFCWGFFFSPFTFFCKCCKTRKRERFARQRWVSLMSKVLHFIPSDLLSRVMFILSVDYWAGPKMAVCTY